MKIFDKQAEVTEDTKLRVAFLGDKPLGVRCLETLIGYSNVDVVAVVCRSKNEKSWWHSPRNRRLIDVVEEIGLTRVSQENLLDYDIDLAISVLYYKIIDEQLINHLEGQIVNLHAAPLPEYRGLNSHSHAIINGETEYGVSLHMIDTGVDTGPIIDVKRFDISPDLTARELHDLAQDHAFTLFVEQLPVLLSGRIETTDQDEIIKHRHCVPHTYNKSSIDPIREIQISDLLERPEYVMRVVRGLDFEPFEPAHIFLNGRKMYLKTKPS